MAINRTTPRILLVQLADMGDLLLAAPAIREVYKSAGGSGVTLLTKQTNERLARMLVDDVVLVDKHLFDSILGSLRPSSVLKVIGLVRRLRRGHFDTIILFHHLVTPWGVVKFALLSLLSGAEVRRGLDNGRGRFLTSPVVDRGFGAHHEREYFLALAGVQAHHQLKSDDLPIHIARTEHDVQTPFVVVHPGSGLFSTARRWPLNKFATVIDTLWTAYGLRSIVVGGVEERELALELVAERTDHAISMAGETDLPALASLLARSVLFVGNDGGVAQLAFVMDVPSVVVYGPTSPATWGPPRKCGRAVSLDLICSPCLYRFKELGTPEGCASRECLWDLPPSRVLAEIEELIGAQHAA